MRKLALIFVVAMAAAQITTPTPPSKGPLSTAVKSADLAQWYLSHGVQEGAVTINGTSAKVTRKPYGSCPTTYEVDTAGECFVVRIGTGTQGDRACDAFVIERTYGGVCGK